MVFILYVIIPVALVVFGKLLGLATSALFFYSIHGKQLGGHISRWSMGILPVAYLLCAFIGLEGDAAHGVTLFGSEAALDWIGYGLYTSIPILAVYAGVIYVVRDLTFGHQPLPDQTTA